jgi:hypothetical protein
MKNPAPEEGSGGSEMDPSYRAWLGSNPAPGEVFVDTGEASAEDSRKLRWSPTKAQREMIKDVISHEVEAVNRLYLDDDQGSYANRMEDLVGETLRNIGVDPSTLKPLAKGAEGSSGGEVGGLSS